MSFLSVSDYLAEPRAPEAWVIRDLLPTGGFLNIFAAPKAGKSFLALQMAAAIANPYTRDFLSFPVVTHGPAAYLQVDTARGIWAERVEDNFIRAGHPLPNVFLADAVNAPYPFNILHEGRIWLRNACDSLKPAVVFVDTIREVHRGDENDSAHMQAAVATLVEATRPAALVVISHSRKNKPDDMSDDLMAENRGSGYLAGRADCVMRVGKERLDYQGRAVERSTLHITRTEWGLFKATDSSRALAERVVKEHSLATQTEQARELMKLDSTMTFDGARSRIRKIQKDLEALAAQA